MVAAVLAMNDGFVPGTLGTECVDPSLPTCRIATETAPSDGGSVLLLSESFGGRCAALALRRA